MVSCNLTALNAEADMYQLLSQFVIPTERTLTEALANGSVEHDVLDILQELGLGSKAEELSAAFNPSAVCGDLDEEAFFHQVRRDYTHLFSNPSFSVMKIHEGEFLGVAKEKQERNAHLNPACVDASRHYRAAGVLEDVRDNQDHMQIELRYMQTLRSAQIAALLAGQEEDAAIIAQEAEDFLAKHLNLWAKHFFEEVALKAESATYQAVGNLGAIFFDF